MGSILSGNDMESVNSRCTALTMALVNSNTWNFFPEQSALYNGPAKSSPVTGKGEADYEYLTGSSGTASRLSGQTLYKQKRRSDFIFRPSLTKFCMQPRIGNAESMFYEQTFKFRENLINKVVCHNIIHSYFHLRQGYVTWNVMLAVTKRFVSYVRVLVIISFNRVTNSLLYLRCSVRPTHPDHATATEFYNVLRSSRSSSGDCFEQKRLRQPLLFTPVVRKKKINK